MDESAKYSPLLAAQAIYEATEDRFSPFANLETTKKIINSASPLELIKIEEAYGELTKGSTLNDAVDHVCAWTTGSAAELQLKEKLGCLKEYAKVSTRLDKYLQRVNVQNEGAKAGTVNTNDTTAQSNGYRATVAPELEANDSRNREQIDLWRRWYTP